ncbi:hypothetical protein A5630_08470 [Mycolicibacterium mucogenicum]|uniref:DUF732 domain-containing protein n=1 Tax=Mycolicibacterium mucogenicum TaxID=56689 RepID=A0A1A3GJ08_MYCMU|nr:DUF732 domain-containing protein [Mycolicibacterium mucogenicum]OBJ36027.1 hypothetical protein A5630_08470 [Mycolicibacterium mucogenicum]
MSVKIRLTAGAVAAVSALSVAAAGPASAWPMPFTPEQQRFINQARNAGFPGDDDAIMQAGLQACQMAFSGQSRPDVVGALAGQYGADVGPTGALAKAAHGILCTSAPN